MIITRTPFRISFFGGGTDYPTWYKENGGAVLSTTIDKYCYITCRYLPPFFKHKHRIVYAKQESVNSINEIDHPSVRETLRFLKINKGVEIHHDGDLPSMSGLGSSSAFTVGLLHALSGLKGEMRTKRQLALEAIEIEQKLIGENVGSQDQTAAAFGGFNRIKFGGFEHISVTPIILKPERLEDFQSYLMLFFTDFARNASTIAKEQIKNIPNKESELKMMHQMVDQAIGILHGRQDLKRFGTLLNEAWNIKRTLSSKITNPTLDEIYATGIKAGAYGGKLLGAGNGGFMLFFAPPEAHQKIRNKLKKLLYVPFKYENLGSQIIYYAPPYNSI